MDLTSTLALYGAATGTIALVLTAIGGYNNLKDRPWLRLHFRIVPVRHGRTAPGLRHVIVELANVGRRRALCHPPVIQFLDVSWQKFVIRSADEVWLEGAGWAPTNDSGDLAPLVAVGEYEIQTYLCELPPGARLISACVTDSLERRKTRYTFLGSTWLILFRVRRRVGGGASRGAAKRV